MCQWHYYMHKIFYFSHDHVFRPWWEGVEEQQNLSPSILNSNVAAGIFMYANNQRNLQFRTFHLMLMTLQRDAPTLCKPAETIKSPVVDAWEPSQEKNDYSGKLHIDLLGQLVGLSRNIFYQGDTLLLGTWMVSFVWMKFEAAIAIL